MYTGIHGAAFFDDVDVELAVRRVAGLAGQLRRGLHQPVVLGVVPVRVVVVVLVLDVVPSRSTLMKSYGSK